MSNRKNLFEGESEQQWRRRNGKMEPGVAKGLMMICGIFLFVNMLPFAAMFGLCFTMGGIAK